MLDAIVAIGAVVLFVIYAAVAWIHSTWHSRLQMIAEEERKRLAAGLPPHPYCYCRTCKTWRRTMLEKHGP